MLISKGMKRYRPNDENVIMFGKEAVLAFQEKRLPDYNLERLKLKFCKIPAPTPITPISSTLYDYSNSKNTDMNEPLLERRCLCFIM